MGFKKPFRAVPVMPGAHFRARNDRDRRGKKKRDRAFMILVVTSAAALFAAIWSLPPPGEPAPLPSDAAASTPNVRAGDPLTACRVTDGDTLRCGDERVRLLGIDAPELPGHCREGRMCAPGDPVASSESLRAALTGNLRIQRITSDRYGRTIALVAGSRGDLSCWQLRRGQAIYRDDWDNGARVYALCTDVARRAGH